MNTVRLDELCTTFKSDILVNKIEKDTGDYPLFGAKGVVTGLNSYQQPKPYISIIKWGAGVGRAELRPAYSSIVATMLGVLPNDDVNINWLCYLLQSMHLEQYATNAVVPNLYFKDYCDSSIPVPSLDEQIRISGFLDKVQRIIDIRKQQLSVLDDLTKARFVEMFGEPELNPVGWLIQPLGDLLSVEPQNGLYKPQSDYVQNGAGTPILRIDAFYNGKVTDFSKLKRLNCTDIEKSRYLLKENDIVINRVNSLEYLGKCAWITGMLEPTVFESNMMRFHVDESRIDPCYVTKLLCSKFIYKQVLNRAKKAVNQASINQGDVQSFTILVPPLELQKKYASFVAQIDKSKSVILKSLDETQLLFDSLMQEYFG